MSDGSEDRCVSSRRDLRHRLQNTRHSSQSGAMTLKAVSQRSASASCRNTRTVCGEPARRTLESSGDPEDLILRGDDCHGPRWSSSQALGLHLFQVREVAPGLLGAGKCRG